MTEELKIYVDHPEDIITKLDSIGAKFVNELEIVDTYFDMPGMVLKLTETGGMALLTQLQAKHGGFRFISEEEVEDLEKKKDELSQKYGIKTILRKRQLNWKYKEFEINLNLFEDIGNFLIVEGEQVASEFFTETLEIEEPQYLTKSFAQLKLEKEKKQNEV